MYKIKKNLFEWINYKFIPNYNFRVETTIIKVKEKNDF